MQHASNASNALHEESIDELPEPPDNAEEWDALPEGFREKVSVKIEAGIAHEWELQKERYVREDRSYDLRNARRVAPRETKAAVAA